MFSLDLIDAGDPSQESLESGVDIDPQDKECSFSVSR